MTGSTTSQRAGRSNSLSSLSYAGLTQKWLVELCQGGCYLSPLQHKTGTVDGRVIHWQDRQMTRRGLHRFLLLIAEANTMAGSGGLWLFYVHVAANDLAHELRVRFPRSWDDQDRARVRLWLNHNRRSRNNFGGPNLRKRMMAWSQLTTARS